MTSYPFAPQNFSDLKTARASFQGRSGVFLGRCHAWRAGVIGSLAGVEACRPHCLRHTFASEAPMAGVSIVQLARVMGGVEVASGGDAE